MRPRARNRRGAKEPLVRTRSLLSYCFFFPSPDKPSAGHPPFLLIFVLTYSRYVDAPISPALKTPNSARSRRKSSLALQKSALSPLSPRLQSAAGFDADDEDGDDFGDDFDDFEEGDEDADFGDFDDGFQEQEAQPAATTAAAEGRRPSSLSFVSLILTRRSSASDLTRIPRSQYRTLTTLTKTR